MQEHYKSRAEAAAYLEDRGLPYSPNTLQKLATTGGGPRYALWGNKAVYLPSDLDAWITTKLKVRTFTSEVA
jgi:hypothetical protein